MKRLQFVTHETVLTLVGVEQRCITVIVKRSNVDIQQSVQFLLFKRGEGDGYTVIAQALDTADVATIHVANTGILWSPLLHIGILSDLQDIGGVGGFLFGIGDDVTLIFGKGFFKEIHIGGVLRFGEVISFLRYAGGKCAVLYRGKSPDHHTQRRLQAFRTRHTRGGEADIFF